MRHWPNRSLSLLKPPTCKGWVFTRGALVMGHALVLIRLSTLSRTSPEKGREHVRGLI